MYYGRDFINPFSEFDALLSDAFTLTNAIASNPNTKVYVATNKAKDCICSKKYPFSDLYEDEDKAYHIDVSCAGFKENEISVKYANERIWFKAKKTEDSQTKKVYVQRGIKSDKEIENDWFVDPRKYDASKVKVTLNDGILSIVVPKSEAIISDYSIGINGNAPVEIIEEKKEETKTEEK